MVLWCRGPDLVGAAGCCILEDTVRLEEQSCCLHYGVKLWHDKPGQQSLDIVSSPLSGWGSLRLKKAPQTHRPPVPSPDCPGTLSHRGLSLSMGDEQLQICPGHRRVTTNVLQNLTHFPWHTLPVTLLLFLLSYLWYG